MSLFNKFFRSLKKKDNLPEGWTGTKISDDCYITHIPKEQKDKWATERRLKDKVEELILKDGFHIKPYGRAGMIYYTDAGKLCEIDFELSGIKEFNLLLSFEDLNEWVLPKVKIMTNLEKDKIKTLLLDWLEKEQIKVQL